MQKKTQTTELHVNAFTWPLLGTTTKKSGKLILVQQFQSAVKGGNISESVVSMWNLLQQWFHLCPFLCLLWAASSLRNTFKTKIPQTVLCFVLCFEELKITIYQTNLIIWTMLKFIWMVNLWFKPVGVKHTSLHQVHQIRYNNFVVYYELNISVFVIQLFNNSAYTSLVPLFS